MEKQKLMPEFQTLQEMADFWETHDLMDYADQLVQMEEPIFDLSAQTITVALDAEQYQRLKDAAAQEQQAMPLLVKRWVVQHLQPRPASHRSKRKRTDQNRTSGAKMTVEP